MPIKGYKQSKEHREELRKSHKGMTGRKQTEETKEKIRQKKLGKKISEETRKKMQKNNSGKNNPMYRHIYSEETLQKMRKPKSKKHKEKLRQSHLGNKASKATKEKMSQSKIGEKHWNWQNGKSFEQYPQEWTDILKEAIRMRDNYICQECGIHQDELIGQFKVLDIHHIDYNKKNCNPKNLITLCRSCHSKTNYNREYWIEYFKNTWRI